MLLTVHGDEDLRIQRMANDEARSTALDAATGGNAVDLMIAIGDSVSNTSKVAGPVASCAGNPR